MAVPAAGPAAGAAAGAVAVAASAGGVEALQRFVEELPEDFPLVVMVVLHIPPTGTSVLPQILSRAGKLPARHARDGEKLAPGVILVAPPDRHLVVEDGRALTPRGPRESGHRPSADTLLRSVATNCGRRGAGVVLSGTMDDGAAGLKAIRMVGGLALVQSPEEATFPGMPLAAIEEDDPNLVGTVQELVAALVKWADHLVDEDEAPRRETVTVDQNEHGVTAPAAASNPGARIEDAIGREDDGGRSQADDITPFTCPECGGTLWMRTELGAERLRCRVGHSFSLQSLLIGKQDALEAALWAAIVALEERRDVTRRILSRVEDAGATRRAEHYRRQADETSKMVEMLRATIEELSDGEEVAAEQAGDGGTAS